LIRSRTDGDTVQARSGDVKQRDAAMASGAQILSTDYPFNEKASWSGYSVSFPKGEIARCNPLLNLPNCSTVH
jgi:Phosphoinositide phospholipase C, Ca2+-dependent